MHFTEIEAIARKRLDNPESYSIFEAIAEKDVVFRIWRYWAKYSQSSWLLYTKSKCFFVRRVEWDRLKDCGYLAFPNGQPTMYGCEADVPIEKAELIVEALKSLSIQPFMTTSQFGIDGVTFGVETKSHWLSGKLTWWGDPPKSWEPLSDWLIETARYFNSLLPASTAQMSDAKYDVSDF